ncbi:hypothetical protein HIM_04176 [Hirsutella minnesotensis 3608]|uniref:FAD-binding domain-containing protein n=1 Tax=Hirsutella minnesotensis 3608 TaxID=1043627 RepID=A0A0F8A1R5_9HYPO|nr:hypothetical protein HIM_04176 [Hirsutella minnesotensis 3608]
MSPIQEIGIIGAGLSGLSLALALHQQGIQSIVYESQPTALGILDKLQVFPRLEPHSYKFERLHFHSENNEPVDDFEFGSVAKYGYPAVRVYRSKLIKILLDMIQERGIRVVYGKKFQAIVSEHADSVTWAFADGSQATASMLIGADGIHSRVRSFLEPDAQPMFTNMMGINAAVPTSQLGDVTNYPLPVTIMNPKLGAFVIAPQLADGSEVFIGRQFRFEEEPDRQSLAALTNNKTWCAEFLQQGNSEYPEIVARATSSISPDRISLWPFYLLPELKTWSSKFTRVTIVGDAAHALPPSAGQGVNQAFEDIYTLSGILGKLGLNHGSKLQAGLEKWQSGRQQRLAQILKLNERMNRRRLPSKEEVDLEPFHMEWLYGADFDKAVADWTSC